MASNSINNAVSQPSETTPLLREDQDRAENGLINSGEGASTTAGTEDSGAPLAVEPSSKELLAILGSAWLGVFLAALGISSILTLISLANISVEYVLIDDFSRLMNRWNYYRRHFRSNILVVRFSLPHFMACIVVLYFQLSLPTA